MSLFIATLGRSMIRTDPLCCGNSCFMANNQQLGIDDDLWRSKKYARLSDDEILELAVKKLNDKERLYLSRELDLRNLNDAAAKAKKDKIKRDMRSKPWWKYLPILFALGFLVKRLFGN